MSWPGAASNTLYANGKGNVPVIVTTHKRIFLFFFGTTTIGLYHVAYLTGRMNPTFKSLSISSFTCAT